MRAACLRLVLIAVAALGASAPALERADAGDPVGPSGPSHRCSVTGRVVDGRENGVPGATVTWIPNAPEGDRSTPAAVRTDDAGRYRLELDGPAGEEVRGAIHVTHGNAAAALGVVVVEAGDREKDVGASALLPARPLHVDVRRDGEPVSGAQVWLWVAGCIPLPIFKTAFLGSSATDAKGRAEIAALPDAVVNLYVRAPDGWMGRTCVDVVPGSTPSRIPVDLVRSRSVEVLVTTDGAPALPIGGARIFRRQEIWLGSDLLTAVWVQVPGPIPPTAEDGRVRVDGLPADRDVELEVRVAGRPVARTECAPDASSVTIVVPRFSTIPVQSGERPPPPDGTKLVVRGRGTGAGGVEARMEGGAIALPIAAAAIHDGLAIAPDGSVAVLCRDKPTSFSAPRSLVVRLLDRDGRGVTGVEVSLWVSPHLEGPWQVPIPTDEEGRARFEGLAPVKHAVCAFPTVERPTGTPIDDVDLGPGDEARDIVIGDEGSLLVRVTVDGRPALPEHLRWGISDAIVLESVTDRAAGILRVRARAANGARHGGSITVNGWGVRAQTVPFAWPARGGTTPIEVPLFAAPEVVVDVRADPEREIAAGVDVWLTWMPHRGSRWFGGDWALPRQAGRTSLELPPGRYRLHDYETGIVSAAFEVPDRGGRVEATLDLTDLVTIRGRVECPNAADVHGVEVVVEGDCIDGRRPVVPFGNTHGLHYDGTSFALRVPAGKPVTISPWHRDLQPAREGGEVTIVGPRDDVVLRMGRGSTLVARICDPSGKPLPVDRLQYAYVAAIPADHPDREAVVRHAEPVAGEEGAVSASGLPFGTLDLWVDVGGFAVCRVPRTAVAEDVTDLGEVRLSRGTRLRLRKVVKDGTAPSIEGVEGHAVGMFGPRPWLLLERSSEGTDVLGEFAPLGEGRWYVEVQWQRATPDGPVHEERAFEIDVDGEHEQTLDVDVSEARPALPR